MHKSIPTTLLVLALSGACAPAAHADSIAYVKGGDVWLTTADGSRQFRVTDTGGYSDVSQADDGTMIALTGVRLRRLDRMGAVLADFDTPVSDTRPVGTKTFFGPLDPAISPDGTKVAYSYYYMTTSQNPQCLPPRCVTTINEAGTAYSRVDRQTPWDEPGLVRHSGWRNPVWVDDRTTMLSDPSHAPNFDVVLDRPGDRAGSTGFMVSGWFSDTIGGNPHTGAGDITRGKDKLAFVSGENDSTLTLSRVSTFPTTFRDGGAPASTRPEVCYRYSGPSGGRFGTPTFSPDGRQVAVAEGDGIRLIDVPDFTAGCTVEGASPETRLLVPGASEPDWGPADVPTSRPTPTSTSSPTPTPTSTPASPGGGPSRDGSSGPTSGGSMASGGSEASGGAGAGAGCRVPALRGLTVSSARRKLSRAGCRVRVVGRGPRVTGQSVKAGRVVAARTVVRITARRSPSGK